MDLRTRQGRLVFVDPEDENISYWWPAIVVPEEEYELFKETMDNDAGVNVGEHERLVCYFEDGSFSIVPKSSLIPFNPEREPFKSYSTRLKNFLTDAGIRRATDFHKTGKIPKMFKWLILEETGYLDPMDSGDSEVEAEAEIEANEFNEDGDVEGDEVVVDHEIGNEQRQQKLPSKVVKNTNGNKRGRKPKNPVMVASTVLVSPKPVSPSDAIKIESLITNSQEATVTYII